VCVRMYNERIFLEKRNFVKIIMRVRRRALFVTVVRVSSALCVRVLLACLIKSARLS
jgi:hypothetical protein